MKILKPEISFSVGARHQAPHLTGDRPVVVILHAHIDRMTVQEIRSMFGSRLKEIIYVPDGLLTVEIVDQMRANFWAHHAGREWPTIVAIGGGSTLDLAKSIRVALDTHHSIKTILDRSISIDDVMACPLLLMPTTAGTESEVSATATLWDLQTGNKHSFFGSAAVADWAVIDPELCMTAPWVLTRDTGVDALCHALEALWNRNRVPQAFAFAMSATQQIVRVLPELKNKPHDIGLRTEMSQAALWAGQAMAITETALVHALSYQDTLVGNLPHGEACARWLPHVYRLASQSSEEMGIYLRAAMEPWIYSETDLQEWLINLGYSPILLSDKNPEIRARIRLALLTTRGKNFVDASDHTKSKCAPKVPVYF